MPKNGGEKQQHRASVSHCVLDTPLLSSDLINTQTHRQIYVHRKRDETTLSPLSGSGSRRQQHFHAKPLASLVTEARVHIDKDTARLAYVPSHLSCLPHTQGVATKIEETR